MVICEIWQGNQEDSNYGPTAKLVILAGAVNTISPAHPAVPNYGSSDGPHDEREQMHLVTLDNKIDFDGWRKAARSLVLNDVCPADVTWKVRDAETDLFAAETSPLPDTPAGTFNVPAKFVELARSAILHRD